MTKLTSKSASGKPGTSSPPGTSVKKGGTGKTHRAKGKSDKFTVLVDRVKELTPDEARAQLVRAGIIDESGQLTAGYKTSKSTKKGARRRGKAGEVKPPATTPARDAV